MATTLVYTVSAYVPFTKILSANINQDKTDIQNRLNWAGGTDVATGLSGDNIQSNTALAETKASVVTQGITLTAVAGQGTGGNSINIAFTSGGVAGAEVVTVTGTAISVQVSSGVSTVTQVVAALNGSFQALNLVTPTGAAATTVATATAVNLTGGTVATGVTRSTKLSLDTANYVVINSATGTMTSEAQLAVSRGGTGISITPANQNPGDVLQINAAKTGLSMGAPTAVPAALRVLAFYQFS